MSPTRTTSGWVGWVWFGAVVMITVGIFNVISGVVSVFSPNTVVTTGNGMFVVIDVSRWGWVHLLLGLLIAVVGVALLAGQPWARVTAIVLVAINAIAQFVSLPSTPWWSLIAIVLDLLVLWALIVHGAEAEEVVD